jgi:hypothetical protein
MISSSSSLVRGGVRLVPSSAWFIKRQSSRLHHPGPDHAQLQTLFTSLIHPTPPLPHQSSSNATTDSTPSTSTPGVLPNTPHPLGKSQTMYARMLASADQSRPGSVDGAGKSRGTGGSIGGPVVWEIRAHATGLGGDTGSVNPAAGFGLGGGGTMVPPNRQSEEGDLRGKAVWVMGRIVGEPGAETENQQSCVPSACRVCSQTDIPGPDSMLSSS